jgi:hypothetical protein
MVASNLPLDNDRRRETACPGVCSRMTAMGRPGSRLAAPSQPKSRLLGAHSCRSVEGRSSSKADIPFAEISSCNRWKAKTGPRHNQSHPPITSHALERDVFRPYPPGAMSGDDHLLGRGSLVRHPPLVAPSIQSSNTGSATPSGRKASSPRLSMTARRSGGPMEAQDPGPWPRRGAPQATRTGRARWL